MKEASCNNTTNKGNKNSSQWTSHERNRIEQSTDNSKLENSRNKGITNPTERKIKVHERINSNTENKAKRRIQERHKA
jgi:hypothetical protein